MQKEEQAKREAEEAQALAQQTTEQWSAAVPSTEVTTDAAAGQWDAGGDVSNLYYTIHNLTFHY